MESTIKTIEIFKCSSCDKEFDDKSKALDCEEYHNFVKYVEQNWTKGLFIKFADGRVYDVGTIEFKNGYLEVFAVSANDYKTCSYANIKAWLGCKFITITEAVNLGWKASFYWFWNSHANFAMKEEYKKAIRDSVTSKLSEEEREKYVFEGVAFKNK